MPHNSLGLVMRFGGCAVAAFSILSNEAFGRDATVSSTQHDTIGVRANGVKHPYGVIPCKLSQIRDGVTLLGRTMICGFGVITIDCVSKCELTPRWIAHDRMTCAGLTPNSCATSFTCRLESLHHTQQEGDNAHLGHVQGRLDHGAPQRTSKRRISLKENIIVF